MHTDVSIIQSVFSGIPAAVRKQRASQHPSRGQILASHGVFPTWWRLERGEDPGGAFSPPGARGPT